MSKLEYDNLYKFLVSFGIILIILPFAALFYFYNSSPILISQTEYDSLSAYTLELINSKKEILSISFEKSRAIRNLLDEAGVDTLEELESL